MPRGYASARAERAQRLALRLQLVSGQESEWSGRRETLLGRREYRAESVESLADDRIVC
jgi:hypothetical protein